MIFFCSRDGTLTPYILPSLNQGSVGSESIVLLAPFPANTTVTAAFTLPNGIRTQRQLAGLSASYVLRDSDGIVINVWTFENGEQDTLDITAFSGILRTQFFFTDAYRHVLSSTTCTQTVNAGVPDLPVNVSEADATAIAAYLAAARTVQEQIKENGLDAVNSALGWASGEELTSEGEVLVPIGLPNAQVTIDLPVFAAAVEYEVGEYIFQKNTEGKWFMGGYLVNLPFYGVSPSAEATKFSVSLNLVPVNEDSQYFQNNSKWYSEHPQISNGTITLAMLAEGVASAQRTPNTLALRTSGGTVRVGTPTDEYDAVPLAFMIEKIQKSDSVFRGTYPDYADVPSVEGDYQEGPDGETAPNNNDYIVVLDYDYPIGDGRIDSGTWKFKYVGVWSEEGKNGWRPEYKINESPLTPEQLEALDSGITADKIDQIDKNIAARVPITPPPDGVTAVYGSRIVDGSADVVMVPMSVDADSNTLALRSSSGTLRGAEALSETDLVNLQSFLFQKNVFEEDLKNLQRAINRNDVRIANLEGLTHFETDSSITYKKFVPARSLQYAEVKSIGGISRRSNNIIPYPYAMSSGQTINGITFTINADRSITAVGSTSSEAAVFTLVNDVFYDTPDAIGTTDSGATNGDVSVGYRVWYNSSEQSISLYIPANTENVNETIFPMANFGNKPLPYEPWYDGLIDIKPTQLVSKGGNLWRPMESGVFFGVTFTVDNGEITLNGTATGTGNKQVAIVQLPADTYTLCAYKEGDFPTGFNVAAYSSSAFSLAVGNTAAYDAIDTGTLTEEASVTLRIRIQGGGVYNNCKIRPTLNRGSVAAPFHPYTIDPVSTFTVPQSVMEKEDYRLGINSDCCNHVEWDDDGVASYKTEAREVVFDGSQDEIIVLDGTVSTSLRSLFKIYIPDGDTYQGAPAVINYMIPFYDNYSAFFERFFITTDESGVPFLALVLDNTKASTVAELRAYLASYPLRLVYGINTPTSEIVNVTTDNFIEVEGAGDIVCENLSGNEYGAPTTIKFQIKEQAL